MPVRREPRAFLRKPIAVYKAAVDSVEHLRLAADLTSDKTASAFLMRPCPISTLVAAPSCSNNIFSTDFID
jgi:hypothetical protein